MNARTSRKKTSHYGKYLERGLYTGQPSLHSEDLPEFRKYFVGEHVIDALRNNENHLIVGRRGTGKTHVLGTFAEIVKESNKKQLCIFISAFSFCDTPPTMYEGNTAFVRAKWAKSMYDRFLNILCEELIEEIYRYISLQEKHKAFTKTELRKIKSSTDNYLLKLLTAVHFGKPFRQRGTQNTQEKGKMSSHRGIGIGGHLNPMDNPQIGLDVSLGQRISAEEEITTNMDCLLSVDPQEIRKILNKIIKLLDLDTVFILIDEWMELDKGCSLGIQPYFAQLLKQTFWNHRNFSVKIASIWHRTDLYDRDDISRAKGLEMGEDLQVGLDLDTAFLTEERDIIQFFKNMLFKRLSNEIIELKELAPRGEISDMFIEEIFDNERNFRSLIAASHGIPRHFWEIFQKCSLVINRNFHEKCISRSLIRSVAREVYLIEKRKKIDKQSDAQRLWEWVNAQLDKKGSRFVIFENRAAKSSTALRKLVDEEFLHPIPSSFVPRIIRDTHKVFNIEYGNYVDWLEENGMDVEAVIEESLLPEFPSDFVNNWHEYIIPLKDFGPKELYCENCGQFFNLNHPVYKQFSVCPHCAKKV